MRKSSIFRQMYLGVSFPIDTLSNRQQFLSINIRLGIFAFGYLALRLIRFYVDMVNVCELIRIITNVLLFRFFRWSWKFSYNVNEFGNRPSHLAVYTRASDRAVYLETHIYTLIFMEVVQLKITKKQKIERFFSSIFMCVVSFLFRLDELKFLRNIWSIYVHTHVHWGARYSSIFIALRLRVAASFFGFIVVDIVVKYPRLVKCCNPKLCDFYCF